MKIWHHFAGTETVWVSDGRYSVHVIAGSDIDVADSENDENDAEKKLRHISGSLLMPLLLFHSSELSYL